MQIILSGTLDISLINDTLLSVHIKNKNYIKKKNVFDYFTNISKNYISLLTSKCIDNQT